MKSWRLRSQVVLVAGLVWVYTLGVGVSYWTLERSHGRLDRSLTEGLTVLSRLPRLREGLRRLDQASDQYLLTGQGSWLQRRDEAIAEVRGLHGEMTSSLSEPRDLALLAESDRRMTAYLAESGPMIARRRAGRLPSAEAERAARGAGGVEAAAEPLGRLQTVNVADLRARRADVERAGRQTLVFILLAGASAAAFTAYFLTRYLTRPIVDLRERAMRWGLGEEWPAAHPAAAREVADLYETVRVMARRLNEQFAKEHELGALKGRLVTMVSHEFNNALSILVSTASLLKATEAAPPSGKRAEYYAILESNLRSLAVATRNLLDLGRLETGRLAVQPRRAEIGAVIREAAGALKPLYERKRHEIELRIPEDAPPALADPEALLLVVSNLLGNAVKYTPEGGRITAGLSVEPERRLRVFVRDTGVGISPEERDRVLRGERLESGRKLAKGFGIGLSVVRSLLEAHHSELEIEGAPGQGTTVSFLLPQWPGPSEGDIFARAQT